MRSIVLRSSRNQACVPPGSTLPSVRLRQWRRWLLGSWDFPTTAEGWRDAGDATWQAWRDATAAVALREGRDDLAQEAADGDLQAALRALEQHKHGSTRGISREAWLTLDRQKHADG